jgi:hypothetical protein
MPVAPIFNPFGGGTPGSGGGGGGGFASSAGTPGSGNASAGSILGSLSAGVPVASPASVAQLQAADIANDATPVVPAGAYDYGSGKVYTAFTIEDVVEGGTERVTRGLWSNNASELTSFWSSSYQSSTQKQYYYEIYNGDPTVSTNYAQFSVAYGHTDGSGSYGQNEDSPSNAIYSQLQQVLLPSNQRLFTFNGVTSRDVYAITINRARLKDKLDPGNWELVLSGSAGETLRLIDDSGDVNQLGSSTLNKYNVVSGSLIDGVFNTTEIYGEVYPQFGVIVLGAAGLDASASLGTIRTSNTDAQNHGKLFTALSGSAVDNVNNGFQARSEEEVKSTFFFVRAKNAEYNFSNNPSYVTGSNGKLLQQTFIGDPKTYITTVGLYNNDNELLAIAKLSKPLLKSFSNEILIKVKLDF